MQSVNKEAVRMLVQDVGYAVASDQLGIPQPTLRQWAKRGQWNATRVHAQAVTSVTRSPAVAQAEIIKANGSETKLGLSEYAKRQAQRLADKGELKDHGAFRNLTAGASQLHGWNEQQGQAQFSLNVLNLGGSVQIGIRNTEAESDSEAPGTDGP